MLKRKKEIRKIDDREDYEKSGFKSINKDVEKTKNEALESVPQIPEEQGQTFVCLAMKKQQRNL